jgi:hypothetical protein
MIGVVVVLSVIVVGLIIFGVSTHEEAGMMDGSPVLDDAAPFTACVRPPYRPVDMEALDSTIDLVNSRLGFGTFKLIPESADCDVVVQFGVPQEQGTEAGGDQRFVTTSGHAQCEVRTTNTPLEILPLVLQHELGHCLGLAHDDFDSSIMRARQYPTPDRVLPPTFTDSDRTLIRDVYGPSLR